MSYYSFAFYAYFKGGRRRIRTVLGTFVVDRHDTPADKSLVNAGDHIASFSLLSGECHPINASINCTSYLSLIFLLLLGGSGTAFALDSAKTAF